MKTFNKMSLKSIRLQLVKVGVQMTDDEFSSLTHSELKKIYKKSQKAHNLYKQVDDIISKSKAPAPAATMPASDKDKDAKGF